MKEFGKIIKTLFILTFIDDVLLRQAIEKQLNKSESGINFPGHYPKRAARSFRTAKKRSRKSPEGVAG